MIKIERLVVSAILLLTVTVTGFAISRSLSLRTQMSQAERKPETLPVSVASVLGDSLPKPISERGRYSLVEFADYQCPPCRAVNKQLPPLLFQNSDRIQFVFRNFPLSFHRYAQPAAIAAEAAREQGKFQPVHDALMTSDLDEKSIHSIIEAQDMDMERFNTSCATTAKAAVKRDMKAA